MQREPEIYTGELDDFGTELTARIVHDALEHWDYPWPEQELRQRSQSSLFMSASKLAWEKDPAERDAHQHVLAKIYRKIRELEGIG